MVWHKLRKAGIAICCCSGASWCAIALGIQHFCSCSMSCSPFLLHCWARLGLDLVPSVKGVSGTSWSLELQKSKSHRSVVCQEIPLYFAKPGPVWPKGLPDTTLELFADPEFQCAKKLCTVELGNTVQGTARWEAPVQSPLPPYTSVILNLPGSMKFHTLAWPLVQPGTQQAMHPYQTAVRGLGTPAVHHPC